MTLLERARFIVATRLAADHAATYLIPGYLRGELDGSEAIQAALADIGDDDQDPNERLIGLLTYKGNSVEWMHSKANKYRDALGRAWDVLREFGYHPDGDTDLADMIRRALAQGDGR